MKMKIIIVVISVVVLTACNTVQKKSIPINNYPDIHIVGAMKDVMWKGELHSKINIDTISNKKNLYGLGPQSYLTGELLLLDGKSYVSKVISDSTMMVQETSKTSAPFFVYANVAKWKEFEVPIDIKDMASLESFIDEKSEKAERPFAFKIQGTIKRAKIHVQNLPKNTQVSSPQEAHQGQTDYELKGEKVEIVGFFSTEHQTIFTHHDTFIHMHLITEDRTKMGHLDEVEIDRFKLSLPIQ